MTAETSTFSAGSGDLARALAEAARAMNEPQTLSATAEAIVSAARLSVPGIDGVTISLKGRDGRPSTLCATDDLADELDAAQWALAEGPCVDTLREQPVLFVEHLRHRQEWPAYVPRAVRRGVRSQLGLQLRSGPEVLGGLNLYSTSSDTVHPDAEVLAEPFAAHAALALANARERDHLRTALDTRRLIGQAVGLVMARYQVDEERAFQFLVRASSTGNVKLREVAADIVERSNREAAEAQR